MNSSSRSKQTGDIGASEVLAVSLLRERGLSSGRTPERCRAGSRNEFQRFLTALSERPGSSFAISIHLLPRRAWLWQMILSSSGVNGPAHRADGMGRERPAAPRHAAGLERQGTPAVRENRTGRRRTGTGHRAASRTPPAARHAPPPTRLCARPHEPAAGRFASPHAWPARGRPNPRGMCPPARARGAITRDARRMATALGTRRTAHGTRRTAPGTRRWALRRTAETYPQVRLHVILVALAALARGARLHGRGDEAPVRHAEPPRQVEQQSVFQRAPRHGRRSGPSRRRHVGRGKMQRGGGSPPPAEASNELAAVG